MRRNEKVKVIEHESCYKKSNEMSMAKLNKGLTLNQMQLLAFAIYRTQNTGKTEFKKVEFQERFGIEKFQTSQAKKDVQKLMSVQFSIEDIEKDYFEFWNVFNSIRYLSGTFSFKWNEDFLPHIIELQEKYVTTDLNITSQFKSSFSWSLYEFLKANYGAWYKKITKESLLKLFCVEDKQTYVKNTARFKGSVLDVAIAEINKYTELDVSYKEVKEGRAITHFELHWSTGKTTAAASQEQLTNLKMISDSLMSNMFTYVNLKHEEYRESAIKIMREVQEIVIMLESAESLLQSVAAEKYTLLKQYMTQLENYLELDKQPQPVPFYNWLKERE